MSFYHVSPFNLTLGYIILVYCLLKLFKAPNNLLRGLFYHNCVAVVVTKIY